MVSVGAGRFRAGLFLALCLCALVYPLRSNAADASAVPRDPLESSRWRYMLAEHFRDAPVVFDARVQLLVADAAEDMGATPVQIRAPALADVTQIRVIADASTPSRVLDYFPVDAVAAIGFSFGITQATPLRAAMRTADGVWHIGGRWVDAQGGGCATPSVTATAAQNTAPSGTIAARSWRRANASQRLKFRIVEPGRVQDSAVAPARFLDEILVRDAHGHTRARLVPGKTLAQQAVITLDIDSREALAIEARDNHGHRYHANVAVVADRSGP